jgi:plastocyanin
MNQFFKSLPILCLFTLVGAQYGNPGNSGSSTMTSSSLPSSTTTSATEVQTVTVGASGLTFSPDTLTVSPGGKVEFHFQPGHSVTQASFANPCHPLSDTSISSGIVSGSNGGSVSRLPIEHFSLNKLLTPGLSKCSHRSLL